MQSGPEYFSLDPAWTDPARLRRERDKGRELKKSTWWRQKVAPGLCHYCGGEFAAAELTMDHIVPLARGGESKKGNVVPACRPCNQSKKLSTPAEDLLASLS
ncbi:MAG TPA: HNH endonuclease [Bdellovibrionota bacterium]|nr:HNH endonuclease [Bdellovibrionota bacterium]